MGSMRFGADLAHVICEPDAGAVIKSYSPDLIVHGVLKEGLGKDELRKEMKGIFERLVSSCAVFPGPVFTGENVDDSYRVKTKL